MPRVEVDPNCPACGFAMDQDPMSREWYCQPCREEELLSEMVLVLCADGTYGPDDEMDEIEDHARVILGLDPREPR